MENQFQKLKDAHAHRMHFFAYFSAVADYWKVPWCVAWKRVCDYKLKIQEKIVIDDFKITPDPEMDALVKLYQFQTEHNKKAGIATNPYYSFAGFMEKRLSGVHTRAKCLYNEEQRRLHGVTAAMNYLDKKLGFSENNNEIGKSQVRRKRIHLNFHRRPD